MESNKTVDISPHKLALMVSSNKNLKDLEERVSLRSWKAFVKLYAKCPNDRIVRLLARSKKNEMKENN